jgi:hypothetical protein
MTASLSRVSPSLLLLFRKAQGRHSGGLLAQRVFAPKKSRWSALHLRSNQARCRQQQPFDWLMLLFGLLDYLFCFIYLCFCVFVSFKYLFETSSHLCAWFRKKVSFLHRPHRKPTKVVLSIFVPNRTKWKGQFHSNKIKFANEVR